ncbi:MAG: hypothetical protein A3D99_02125 [Candidatus Andersenbacteria bacterium RIFCSPHIGHO2_12_FULL_45_11]|uniref:Uncharacterized protein n=1 Tax=Candidatus Andersenbacteria bacterium RIFCSPHIGHO2_12_FULL_45_11 TaxID=1797281 RepID=A0A1G1X202_9BACT|nr:MAG: hypothetical protein A3D99_02125 [Candidatus Andersenbacteria bacterium RIFCSPHIGHO2_12_FULL_45_11]
MILVCQFGTCTFTFGFTRCLFGKGTHHFGSSIGKELLMSQAVLSARGPSANTSSRRRVISNFTLHTIVSEAKRQDPPIRIRADTDRIVCGCYNCTHHGDISLGQSVRLVMTGKGVTMLLHTSCSLEDGMEEQRLPKQELIDAIQRVPGVERLTGPMKPR